TLDVHAFTTRRSSDLLFVSKEYAQKYGVPQSIADLKNHRFIGHRFMTHNRLNPLTLNIDGEERQIALESQLIFNDTEIMMDAIRSEELTSELQSRFDL